MRPRNPVRRPRQRPPMFSHGWGRTGDPIRPCAPATTSPSRMRTPPGTSFLLLLIVFVVAGAGIARVRASTEVLAVGAEITELTDEQTRLTHHRQRLLAERAYLRHPEQIAEVARERLHMVPAEPRLVQKIRLVDDTRK